MIERLPTFESMDTMDLKDGVARHWRLGNIAVQWYVERPRESWLRFDSYLSVQWFAEVSDD